MKGQHRLCRVAIGEPVGNLSAWIPEGRSLIITDRRLQELHGHHWAGLPAFVVEPGEQSKSLDTAAAICRWLMEQGADRSHFITGIGGGVVCDLAGFVASTFMRGIDFGFVATSLLAQVDASVGGKNGVNLDGYKNIVGTFNQPRFVLCDTGLLRTLPREEIQNGMAEVIKHGLIADCGLFERLEQLGTAALDPRGGHWEYLVSRSVHIKAAIVERDEREAGERRKLNLGHTWGHALEKTGRLPHGFAVAVGLSYAASLSVARGLMRREEHERVVRLLKAVGLPTAAAIPPETVWEALTRDKKREGDRMHFVLNKGIGEVVVEPLSLRELHDFTMASGDRPWLLAGDPGHFGEQANPGTQQPTP